MSHLLPYEDLPWGREQPALSPGLSDYDGLLDAVCELKQGGRMWHYCAGTNRDRKLLEPEWIMACGLPCNLEPQSRSERACPKRQDTVCAVCMERSLDFDILRARKRLADAERERTERLSQVDREMRALVARRQHELDRLIAMVPDHRRRWV